MGREFELCSDRLTRLQGFRTVAQSNARGANRSDSPFGEVRGLGPRGSSGAAVSLPSERSECWGEWPEGWL
jgi:hypothetical protein